MEASPLIDAAGRLHQQAGKAKILSLVPSLTELMFDLGLEDSLVGRTAFCVHPKERVKLIPSVGGTKQVNWKKVEAAAPTHALVNIDETPKELAEALNSKGIIPVVTHPIAPQDNLELFRFFGLLFNRERQADALCQSFNSAWDSLQKLRPSLPERKVLYLIWKDPFMTVSRDTYISQMLNLINWRSLGHDENRRYPEVSPTSQYFQEADFILFATEPFPFKEQHLKAFTKEHPDIKAELKIVDGEMFSWYGSRSIECLKLIKRMVVSPLPKKTVNTLSNN